MRQSARLQNMSQETLFDQITNILTQQFGTLPSSGIIAGQAVASAIYSILDISHIAPYNDLDVFGTEEELPQGIFNSVRYKPGLARNNAEQSVGLFQGSFSYNIGVINVGSYSIEDSTVDPINFKINYVKVRAHGQSSTVGFARHIINGFDINCVQVAIDTKSKEVHWTPAFLDFIDTLRLAVTFFGTPMHSAVRLLKKKDALPWAKLNVHAQMQKLQTVRQLIKLVEEEKTTEHHTMVFPGNLFSEIYRARAAEYESVLGEYFTMEHRVIPIYKEQLETTEDVTFYLLQPKSHDKESLTEFLDTISMTGQSVGEAYQFHSIEFLIRLYTKFNEIRQAGRWESVRDTLHRFAKGISTFADAQSMLLMHVNETLFDPMWAEEASELSIEDFEAVTHLAAVYTRVFENSRRKGLAFTRTVANAVKAVSSMNARYLVRMIDGCHPELNMPDSIDVTNLDNWAHPLFLNVIKVDIERDRERMKGTSVPYPEAMGSLDKLSTANITFRKYDNLLELHDELDRSHWSAQIMAQCEGTYVPLEFEHTTEHGSCKGAIILRYFTVKVESGSIRHCWQVAGTLFDGAQPSIQDEQKFASWLHNYPGESLLDHFRENDIRFEENKQAA